MDGVSHLFAQRRRDKPLTFEAATAGKSRGNDGQPEMRLPLRPVTGMSPVEMRFVDDFEPFGRECLFQLASDCLRDRHGHFRYAVL